MGQAIKKDQLHELLYQALETEAGGIKVYETALKCAINEDLHEEWEGYLEETRKHHKTLLGVFQKLGLDPEESTPGRTVVAHLGASFVKAMELALKAGDPEAAQLVAGECVVLAETKDHLNWTLIDHACENATGKVEEALQEALDIIGNDEDHHLYHSAGWTRELWIDALGLPAVLPPPEEEKHVETAIGASRAEQARDEMLKRN
ncbi:MAG: hypothetical protein C0454_11840 [Parvibaculum sp.]|nr:hypothetical protein [Parvibaculum sp.]